MALRKGDSGNLRPSSWVRSRLDCALTRVQGAHPMRCPLRASSPLRTGGECAVRDHACR